MNAQASSFPEVQEQTIEGNSATTHMALKADDTKLSFICPSVINFAMKANGEFIAPTAGQAYIENLSLMPLRMKSYTVTSDPAAKGMISTTSATDDNAYEVKIKTQLGNATPFAVTQSALTSSEWSMTKAGGDTPKLDLTFSDGKMVNITNHWGSGAHLQDVVWNATADVNNQVTVQFDSVGGSSVPDQTFTTGGKATVPTAPTRDGYIFEGWCTDSACTQPFNFDGINVNQYTLLFAKWTAFPHHSVLNEYTWGELKIVSEAISNDTIALNELTHVQNMTSAGETIKVDLSNEDAISFRILGIKHDDKADGSGKAGLTFQAVNSFNQQIYSYDKGDRTSTYAIGWAVSPLRSRLQIGGDLYSLFPSELTNNIATVTKISNVGYSAGSVEKGYDKNNNTTSNDTFFLPSHTELGNTDFEAAVEGSAYEYVANDPYNDTTWEKAHRAGSSYSKAGLFASITSHGFEFLEQHKNEYSSFDNAFGALINEPGAWVPGEGEHDDLRTWTRSPYPWYSNMYVLEWDGGCSYSESTGPWASCCCAPCFCL